MGNLDKIEKILPNINTHKKPLRLLGLPFLIQIEYYLITLFSNI